MGQFRIWYLSALLLATAIILAVEIDILDPNWKSTAELPVSTTPTSPSTYVAHTATRPPIVGDIIVTDGTQFGAFSERDALAIQQGNLSGDTVASKYFGFNLHLAVISADDRVLHVRAIELDGEYWVTRSAVWPNVR